MALDLSSVCAKQRRAKEHLDTLQSEVLAWNNTDTYRAVKKTNADSTRYSIFPEITRDIPFEHLTLIGSDCIHNLRSALDHLVYAIAVHESKKSPPPQANKLAFVIGKQPNDFKGFRNRISVLSPTVQAAIGSVQPYQRMHPEVPPLLSLLHDFDIADKHKLLNVCCGAIHQGNFGTWKNLPPGQEITVGITKGDLKNGAEIAMVIFDRPTPNVTYNWEGELVVAIHHEPGPNGENISEFYGLLSMIYREVDDVIRIVSAAVR